MQGEMKEIGENVEKNFFLMCRGKSPCTKENSIPSVLQNVLHRPCMVLQKQGRALPGFGGPIRDMVCPGKIVAYDQAQEFKGLKFS